MKYWAVQLADASLHVIGSTKKPNKPEYVKVAEAPFNIIEGKPEDPEWLQFEMVEVSPGVWEERATVDEATKTTVEAARAAAVVAEETARNTELDQYKALKTKLLAVTYADLNNADAIRTTIIDLRDALAAFEKEVFDLETT